MKRYFASLILVGLFASAVLAFTYTFDTDDPADGDSPTLGAQEIREFKTMVQEFETVDHYWPIDGNNQVVHADSGMHKQVTFQAVLGTPTMDPDQGIMYMQDVDGGAGAKAELFWHGEDDIQLQMTELNTAGNAAALNLTGTYENELALTNTGNTVYTDNLLCTSDTGIFNLPDDSTDTTEANLRYNTTDDTVEYRNTSAWKQLLVSTNATNMKVGNYTGDDAATKAITGVGFQPEILLIMAGASSEDACIKTSSMSSTNCKSMGGATTNWLDDSIRSLDADGFTVGDGTGGSTRDNMNDSGITYYYIAVDILS